MVDSSFLLLTYEYNAALHVTCSITTLRGALHFGQDGGQALANCRPRPSYSLDISPSHGQHHAWTLHNHMTTRERQVGNEGEMEWEK